MTLQIDGVLYLRILDPFKVCAEPDPGPSSLVCGHPLIRDAVLFPGELRRGGSRVRRHAAGTDHHALGAGEAHAGQSLQGNFCVVRSLNPHYGNRV